MSVYSPNYAGQFKKDYKLAKKRGCDVVKLEVLLGLLLNGIQLPQAYKAHPLSGPWTGAQEAHIEPDWILIYRYVGDDTIRFERTGTHSDLFG
jgi:mRNA interferase YafQ